MANPEQIKAFEGQIERSIDLHADYTDHFSEKDATAIRALKTEIVRLVKKDRDNPDTPEKEEKYSADLRLDKNELASILKDVLAKHPQICADNDISSLEEFEKFLAFDVAKIKQSFLVERLTLFGKPIQLNLDAGISKIAKKNYTAAFKKIGIRADLKKYITPETQFSSKGGSRVEFSLEIEGEVVKYTASPEGVFRVDQEAPMSQTRAWKDAGNEFKEKQVAMENEINADETLNAAQKQLVLLISCFIDKDRAINYRKKEAEEIGDNFEVPKKYQDMIDENKVLYAEMAKMKTIHSVRMLRDEITGETIKEIGDPGRGGTNEFKYIYTSPDGKIKREVEYYQNRILRDTEYDENEQVDTDIKYCKDGTIDYRRIGNIRDHYDDDGTLYARALLNQEGEVYDSGLLSSNGTYIGRFEHEQSRDPKMNEARYLRKFNRVVKTPDRFYKFEEITLSHETDDSLILKLRQRGKEITGLDKQERALEDRYGIKIETEVSASPACKNERHTIKNLVLEMKELASLLAKYPPGFIEATGLKRLEIISGWQVKDEDGNYATSGGLSFGKGQIGMNSLRGLDHELYHCADNTHGGYGDENADWGERAHGHGYEELYGKHGSEAIISGKAYGARPKGHASAYAKHGGINEDQAETGEALMRNLAVLAFAESEPALAMKVKMAKEFYYRLSDGKMDEIFWKDIGSGKTIDAAYWARREKANDFVASEAMEMARDEALLSAELRKNLQSNSWEKVMDNLSGLALCVSPAAKMSKYHEEVLYRFYDTFNVSKRADLKRQLQVIWRFIGTFPNESTYSVGLGYSYDHLGIDRKAIGHYEAAIKEGSRLSLPYEKLASHHMVNGRIAESVEVCDQWIAMVKHPSADECKKLAIAYLFAGEGGKAERIFEYAIQEFPDKVDLKLKYVQMFSETNPERAIMMLHAYIDEDQDNSDLSHTLCDYNGEHMEKVIAVYEKLCKDNPKNSSFSINLSGLYQEKFRVMMREVEDESGFNYAYDSSEFLKDHPSLAEVHSTEVKHLEASLKKNPNRSAYLRLMDAYTEEGRFDDMVHLVADAAKRMKLESNYSTNEILIAKCLKVGKAEELIRVYSDMLKEDPKNPAIYTLLGDIYWSKDPKKTIEYYELAVKNGSKRHEVYEWLARLYKAEGKVDKRIAVLEAASEHTGGRFFDKTVYSKLGDAYLERGLKGKAIEAYEIATKDNLGSHAQIEYLYYSHEGNLQKALEFHFAFEMRKPNYDVTSYSHQAELARFYGKMMKESLKENFEDDVQIDQDFLIENSDIGLLHSEMTDALEKACGNSKARRGDYEALSKAYFQQGQYELAEQIMREAPKTKRRR